MRLSFFPSWDGERESQVVSIDFAFFLVRILRPGVTRKNLYVYMWAYYKRVWVCLCILEL